MMWSRTGLDLHVSSAQGYRDLADAIRRAVRDGRLTAGARMPSTRSLAADLGLARGTVTRAYEQLAIEGYLLATPRGATTVAARISRDSAEAVPGDGNTRPPRWNLHPGLPDLTAFPRTDWLSATRAVLTRTPASLFAYGDPLGAWELRTALADYLGRARGVVTRPDRLVICTGYSQALFLLGTVLRQLGVGRIGFEDPSLPAFRDVVHHSGLSTVAVPVDGDGAVVDGIGAPAAVLTPAHQFPLGMTLHPARRTRIADLARRGELIVVEDDYDGEFRFDREPVGAVQSLAPEQIVYAGTASKTLAPGLRLAWLALPPRLVEPMRAAKAVLDRQTPVMDQLVFAELLSSGRYDRHVRRMRTRYRRRRDRLLAALQSRPVSLWPAGVAAGLHATVALPDGVTEAEVRAVAARHSVGLHGLAHCWMRDGWHPAGIMVGYACPPEHGFTAALEALMGVLDEVFANGRR